jgi:acetyltransferase-like isoleucine patch superfamily enzyme
MTAPGDSANSTDSAAGRDPAGPSEYNSGRIDAAALLEWARKWRWYQRSRLPWNRLALHAELARRHAFARGPVHGNVLEMLREGRLQIGAQAYFEPGVWLTSDTGRITIGGGSLLNLNVMIAALERVDVGEHCMLANGCLVTDANHRYDDPARPVPWQGFTSKGPTVLGDNVWLGANVVVTSGVTIGRRCVIGANSVVTSDVPEFTVAVGAPAKVIASIPH